MLVGRTNTRHSAVNSYDMDLVKLEKCFFMFLLLINLLPTGCSSNHTSKLDSDNYSTATARVKALKNEIIAPSDFTDAAFELYNVNGFSNSRFSVPGASSWDYRFAVKIAQADIVKWTQEMTRMTELNIDLEWTRQITRLENTKWHTQSQPEYFQKPEEDVFLIVYRNESIVFKRVIAR